MSHHHHNHNHNHNQQQQHHRLGALDPDAVVRRAVHRIGRRQFLADLGRRTLAVAIVGAGAAACSGSSPSSTPAAATPTTRPAESTATPADETAGEPADEAAPELQWSQVSLGFVSAYVLVRGNEAAVVDTGNPGSAGEIGGALAALGVGYGDVGHVILTHHHPDHVGSLSDVLTEAPTAVAYAGEADIDTIASSNPLRAVGDGDDVFGLEVINTPGHTPGSISVLDTGIGLLIAGDALNGNDDGTEVSGPNPSFTADMVTATASVAKLAGFEFEAAAFGHGNPVVAGAGAQVDALAGT